MMSNKVFENISQNEHLGNYSNESQQFNEADRAKAGQYGRNATDPLTINKVRTTIIIIFTLTVLFAFYSWRPRYKYLTTYQQLFPRKENRLLQPRFPKVLWIYTQHQRDAEQVQEDIYLTYFDHFAKKAKYEVRYVTSLTAYDYLTNETIASITNTMNKRTVDETVHNLLKIALLHEHGGMIVEPGTIFMSEDFEWIERMFDEYQTDFDVYACKPKSSTLFIPKHGDEYSTYIMAAVPQSPIIGQLFNFLTQILISEEYKMQQSLPPRYNIPGIEWDENNGVYHFQSTLSNCINHLLKTNKKYEQKCISGIQQLTLNMTILIKEDEQLKPHVVAKKVNGFVELLQKRGLKNRNQVKAISGFNTPYIKDPLLRLAVGRSYRKSIQNTLLYKVLEVPGNKQIFLQDLPQRSIELCLVIMQGLTNEQLAHTSTLFKQQTYVNWKLVMPAKDLTNAPKFEDARIVLMQQKSTKVHNIEKAVTNHCPHRGYAVVLNYNQTFPNPRALQNIARTVQPREFIGAYINLEYGNQLLKVTPQFTEFYRFTDGIVNPRLDMMQHMVNHFRVFSVQTFKTIPQYMLRDWNGKYFKDRVIFLMDFHDLIHRRIVNIESFYMIKKAANVLNIPSKVAIADNVALLRATQLEEIDQEQLKRTHTRVSARNLKIVLYDLHRYKVPVSKLAAFNPGHDFVPVQEKQGPQLIPRIIHQVWLGSEIPPAKQYIIQKTKKVYPSYQIKVWRQNNITRELFPTTYDLIRNLIQYNKRSPFNKLATVTDIMRHEILYREGGLWKDAGMSMLRPIPDAFLKYKLILPTDRLYQSRYLQGMCFFANMPGYENMLRINNYRNLNQMRIHDNDPFNIAGPVDFRKLLVGQEQFDPQILLLPYQTFYPGQLQQHPEDDLCTTANLKRHQKYQIKEGKFYLLTNCEEKYPYSFAIEHNIYGSTWVKPKRDTSPLGQLLQYWDKN